MVRPAGGFRIGLTLLKALSVAGGLPLTMLCAMATVGLIPYVAIAPRGFIKKHQAALRVLSHQWLAGIEALRGDVPAAARRVSQIKGAPRALDLIKTLSQLEQADLLTNARMAGFSGRSPLTLETLFRRCWWLWRMSGVLASPAPKIAPVALQTLAALVRTHPSVVEAVPATAAPTPASASTGQPRTLLSHWPGLHDWIEPLFVPILARLAAVFRPADIRVTVTSNLPLARRLIERTCDRYDLHRPERIVAVRRPRAKHSVAFEIVARD